MGFLMSIFGLNKASLILIVVLVSISGTAIAGGVVYWRWSQSEIAALNDKAGKQEAALAQQTETINELEQNFRLMREAQEDLQTRQREIRDQARDFERMLDRHDLNFLATRKPGLIERRANDAIEAGNEELEELTRDR